MLEPNADKAKRTAVHKCIRTHFAPARVIPSKVSLAEEAKAEAEAQMRNYRSQGISPAERERVRAMGGWSGSSRYQTARGDREGRGLRRSSSNSTIQILARKCRCPSNHNFLARLDARVEAVAREFNPQEVANLVWAYATMRREPGRRVLAQLDARV